MKKTENLELNQWESTDRIMMEDFNNDNKIIDKLLGKHEQQLGNLRIEQGTYVGTGVAGKATPNTLTFSGKPVLVFVGGGDAVPATMLRDSILTYYINASLSAQMILSWGENSVSWYSGTDTVRYQMNTEGVTYSYLALVVAE